MDHAVVWVTPRARARPYELIRAGSLQISHAAGSHCSSPSGESSKSVPVLMENCRWSWSDLHCQAGRGAAGGRCVDTTLTRSLHFLVPVRRLRTLHRAHDSLRSFLRSGSFPLFCNACALYVRVHARAGLPRRGLSGRANLLRAAAFGKSASWEASGEMNLRRGDPTKPTKPLGESARLRGSPTMSHRMSGSRLTRPKSGGKPDSFRG